MSSRRSTPRTLHQAGELRKQTTPAEKKLWAYLRIMREEGVRFRRQHAIGPFITDFSPEGDDVRTSQKTIIELDRSQHLEQEEYDQDRTSCLETQGDKVLRFWNNSMFGHRQTIAQRSFRMFSPSVVSQLVGSLRCGSVPQGPAQEVIDSHGTIPDC